jgi:hypothetical protein
MNPSAVSIAAEIVKLLTTFKAEDQGMVAMSMANIERDVEKAKQGSSEMLLRLQYSLGGKGNLDLHGSPDAYRALLALCDAFHEALSDQRR